MTNANFIPSVWSGEILANLNKAQVFAQPGVCNRNYEGEIRQAGDTVKIGAIGPITVGTYTKGTDMSAAEQLKDASTSMVIDQQKYFNFSVDDIDRVQANVDLMGPANREAAYALSNTEDSDIAGLYTDAASANLIGSSGSPKTDLATAGKAYEYLVNAKQVLDEANVPDTGRWIVIPPWYEAKLLLDDRFTKSQAVDIATSAIRNGTVGRVVMGFTVLKSNNVKNYASTNYAVMFGYDGAITLAEQIVQVEAYRLMLQFGDAVKGLLVYGRKVVRPNGLGVIFAQKA